MKPRGSLLLRLVEAPREVGLELFEQQRNPVAATQPVADRILDNNLRQHRAIVELDR